MRLTTGEDISSIWEDLISEVETERSQLEDEFEETYDVPTNLERPLRQRERGEKVHRTLPVVRAYESYAGERVPRDILEYLVARDVFIDVWDDIIDTPDLAKEEKIELTINADFADQLRLKAMPRENREHLLEQERHYKTLLFNIPYQEHRQKARMDSATTDTELLDAAEEFYRSRARVIDGFTYLPERWFDIDGVAGEDIRADLRTNTARRQLFKDLRDVPQDVEDGDEKPPILFMREYSSPSDAADYIREIQDAFDYSQRSRRSGYINHLTSLEQEPDNIEAAISRQMQHV